MDINDVMIWVLIWLGCEVVVVEGVGCCGVLIYYMGKMDLSYFSVVVNICVWCKEMDGEGLDVIVINILGCGMIVKDYSYMFWNEVLVEDVVKVFEIVMDIFELLIKFDILGLLE